MSNIADSTSQIQQLSASLIKKQDPKPQGGDFANSTVSRSIVNIGFALVGESGVEGKRKINGL
jgi:hypothetical protein